jgi:nucleoid DNA-binding protein
MNKDSLVNKIYVKSPFNKGKSLSIFNRIISLIKSSVKEDSKFDIENFGDFTVERREMRNIIDTGKKAIILLPPKDKVVFNPSKNLIKDINNFNE